MEHEKMDVDNERLPSSSKQKKQKRLPCTYSVYVFNLYIYCR